MSEDIEILKHKAVHKGELCFEGLYIDKRKRIVVHKENEIDLTYTEFEILLLLAQNAGIVFSKEQIYDRVWKEPYYGCLLYTSPSPRDGLLSRMPSSA